MIRAIALRDQGMSYQKIADTFNAEGIPTPCGGSLWLKSSVDRLLHTQHTEAIRKEMEDEKQVSGCANWA